MKTCQELEKELLFEDGFMIIPIDTNLLEQKYGNIPDSKGLSIHIESTEGSIPHIHIQKKNGKKENCICHIKLLSAEYLRDKNDPMNTLDTHERKALNDFMHGNLGNSKITRWEDLIYHWNDNNPKYFIDTKYFKCPDYIELK